MHPKQEFESREVKYLYMYKINLVKVSTDCAVLLHFSPTMHCKKEKGEAAEYYTLRLKPRKI